MENTTCGVPVSEQEEETRKGPWTLEEDMQLIRYINAHGEGRWSFLAKAAGLKRSGKSCRLRWVNYLRPDLKHDKITPEEERLIIELHACWGNRWSRIAQSLPGRTDNEIKNYWRTHITKKVPQDDQRNTIDSNQRFEHSMCSSWMPDSCERSIWQEKTFALSTSFPVTDNMSIYRKNIPSIEDPPGKDGPNEIKPTSFPSGQIDISINNQSEQQPDTFRLDDDGQEASLQQHNWKGSHDLFSNTLPPNFSVNSLTAMLSEFYADDTVDACKISNCSYMGSPESFSDAESSWNAYYSDVLWNMDNDEDRFLHGQPLDRSGSHSAISHDHHVRD